MAELAKLVDDLSALTVIQAAELANRERIEQLLSSEQMHQEHAERFAAELLAVHASSSWRLTRPLRWFTRCLRGLAR